HFAANRRAAYYAARAEFHRRQRRNGVRGAYGSNRRVGYDRTVASHIATQPRPAGGSACRYRGRSPRTRAGDRRGLLRSGIGFSAAEFRGAESEGGRRFREDYLTAG